MVNIKIELTMQELQIVGQGLAELPFKQVQALMAKIDGQVRDQVAVAQESSAAIG